MQPLVGSVHVARYDGHVLEPAVVAARVDGRGSSPRCQVFRELEVLVSELEADDPHADGEDATQLLVGVAGDFDVAHGRESEEARVEVDRAVHVRDRHPDRVDRPDPRLLRPRPGGEEKAREEESEPPHPRLSPTRSARRATAEINVETPFMMPPGAGAVPASRKSVRFGCRCTGRVTRQIVPDPARREVTCFIGRCARGWRVPSMRRARPTRADVRTAARHRLGRDVLPGVYASRSTAGTVSTRSCARTSSVSSRRRPLPPTASGCRASPSASSGTSSAAARSAGASPVRELSVR